MAAESWSISAGCFPIAHSSRASLTRDLFSLSMLTTIRMRSGESMAELVVMDKFVTCVFRLRAWQKKLNSSVLGLQYLLYTSVSLRSFEARVAHLACVS